MSDEQRQPEKTAKLESAGVTVRSVCLEIGLYDEIDIELIGNIVTTLRSGSLQFDGPCIECGKESTFKSLESRGGLTPSLGRTSYPSTYRDPFFQRTLYCTRFNHPYRFYFLETEKHLIKIGQYPSIQDIAITEIRKYSTILQREDFRELNVATGLFSHGVGIGSFAYLRRIFERLIFFHFKESKLGMEIDEFSALRMDEKIEKLKAHLPKALVRNKSVYKILSRGIHELDEDTCLKAFPVIRSAILLILEQDLDARRRAADEAKLENEIQQLNSTTAPTRKKSSSTKDEKPTN